MQGTTREELIAESMIIVQRIAGTLMRSGQSPAIEKDDLLQIGYLEAILTVDQRHKSNTTKLESAIARRVQTAMVRYLTGEKKHREETAYVGLLFD